MHCYEESSNLLLNKSSNGNSEDLFLNLLSNQIYQTLLFQLWYLVRLFTTMKKKKQIKLCSDQNTKVIWKLFKGTLK